MDALAAMPEQVANELGETVGNELRRMVGDDERPGALSAALDCVTGDAAKSLAEAVKPIQEALLGSGPKALPQVLEVRLLQALTRGTRVALDQLFDVEGGSPLMTHLANGEKAVAGLRQDTTAIEEPLRTFFGNLPEPASHRHQRRRPPTILTAKCSNHAPRPSRSSSRQRESRHSRAT